MDLHLCIKILNFKIGDASGWVVDVAEAEDKAGLLFRPGGVASRELAVGAEEGFIIRGHGVRVGSVVFGMHFVGG